MEILIQWKNPGTWENHRTEWVRLPEGRNLLKMRKHMANAKLMPTPK